MKRRSSGSGVKSEMNLTNLIDVVFFLLIVFMITAPLMAKGIKVDLPKAAANPLQDPQSVTVSVDAAGQLFVNGEITQKHLLAAKFTATWDQKSPVLFQADSTVDYGLAIQVIAELRKAGAQQLGFLTREPAHSR